MEENQYFVQIKDPAEIRKGILGSSRQIIQILQRYERIKILRVKKIEKISQLRSLNKEINLLVAKLKNVFPTPDIRIKQDRINTKTAGRKDESKATELAKLEAELRFIEDKIGKLA